MNEEQLINRLTTLANSNEIIADNINVDKNIFKETIELIDKQEKIIDSLAQWISNLSPMVDKQAVKDIIYKENKYE